MGRLRTVFSYTAPAIMAVLGLLWFWRRRKKPDDRTCNVNPASIKITADNLSVMATDSINRVNPDMVDISKAECVSVKMDGASGMNESGDCASLDPQGVAEKSKLHPSCGDSMRTVNDIEGSENTSVHDVKKEGECNLLEQDSEETRGAVTGDVIFASHASVKFNNLPINYCDEKVPLNNELNNTSDVVSESEQITYVDMDSSLTEVPAMEELSVSSDVTEKTIAMNDEHLHSPYQESLFESVDKPVEADRLLLSIPAVPDQQLLNDADSTRVDNDRYLEQEELVVCESQKAQSVERTEEYSSVDDRCSLDFEQGSVSCTTKDDGVESSETSEKSETDSGIVVLSPVTDSGIVMLSPETDSGIVVLCSDTTSIEPFSPKLASSDISAQIQEFPNEACICGVENKCADLSQNVDIRDIVDAENSNSSKKIEVNHSMSSMCDSSSCETNVIDEQCQDCDAAEISPDSVISDHTVCDDGLVKSLSELTCLSVDSLESAPDTESRSLVQSSAEPSMPCQRPPEEAGSPRSRSISLQSHDSLEPEPLLIQASLATSDKYEHGEFSDISDTSLTEDDVVVVSDADNSVIIVSDDLAVLSSAHKKENRRRSRKPRYPKGDVTFSSPAVVDLTQDDDDGGLGIKRQSDALTDSLEKEAVVNTEDTTHKHTVETKSADHHADVNQNCISASTIMSSATGLISSQTLDNIGDTQVKPGPAEHNNRPISWATAEKLHVDTIANAISSQNSDNNSEISNDSGKGASLIDPMMPMMPILPATTVYEFAIPSDLTGRLIGRLGHTVHSIMDKSGSHVVVLANPFQADMKTVALEGTEEQIDTALHLIRQKFPLNNFPTMSLNRIVNPAVQSMQAMHSPAIMPEVIQINLPMGVSVEVVVSNVISAGHLFVQQCYHPSFLTLEGMHRTINACYSQGDTVPTLPWPLQDGVICVAPTENGWFRAQVMAVDEQTENCEVKFVDSGRFATLPYSELRQIRRDFMTVPFQAVEVYMSNVTPLQDEMNFSDAAYKALEDLCQGVILQAQVVAHAEDGIPLVHLYYVNGSKAILVNRELVNIGVARWIEQV